MNKQSNKRRVRRRPRAPYFGDFSGAPGGETIHVIGDPAKLSGTPVMRAAKLEDCEDECPMCQELRRQILAGDPPQVMVFE